MSKREPKHIGEVMSDIAERYNKLTKTKMSDIGIDKATNNLRLKLEIDIKSWLDRETPPTSEEWDEYKRQFNKYIEFKPKRR
jgi:DNA-binding SARP family transcriptional activator